VRMGFTQSRRAQPALRIHNPRVVGNAWQATWRPHVDDPRPQGREGHVAEEPYLAGANRVAREKLTNVIDNEICCAHGSVLAHAETLDFCVEEPCMFSELLDSTTELIDCSPVLVSHLPDRGHGGAYALA